MNEQPIFFVIPAPGLTVRDPLDNEQLPPEGALKPRNSFWLRRLTDGDVNEGVAPTTDLKKGASK